MKKIIFIMAMGLMFFTSCVGIKTSTSGLDNEVFLEFIGIPDNYLGGIDVTVDDKAPFKAEVHEDLSRPNGNVYSISSGNHVITVSYANKVIYKKQVYLSAQVTQKIVL